MSHSIRLVLLGFAALFLFPVSAKADWKTFWREIHVGFHRNNDWPKPFQQADVHDVRKPFEIIPAYLTPLTLAWIHNNKRFPRIQNNIQFWRLQGFSPMPLSL